MIVILLVLGTTIMSEERDFDFIRSLFLKKSFGSVITEIRNFKKRYPESRFSDDLHYLEAESYFQLMDYQKSAILFTRYLKFSIRSEFKDDALLRVIQSHFALGNDDEVVGWSRNFPEDSPKYPEAIYFRGETNYRRGLYHAAEKDYQKVLAFATGDLRARTLYSLGYTYFQLKDYDDCISTTDRLIRDFPDHDLAREAHFLKARALIAKGRKDEALDYLEFISEQDEDIAVEAKILAGDLALKDGDYDRARLFYQRILRYYPLYPSRVRAYIGLGHVALRQGRFNEAIRWFRVLLDSFPESDYTGLAKHDIGIAYLGLKKFALARRYLGPSKDYYHIGLSFFEEGDYPNAIKYLSLLESTPKVERLIGEAYYRLKDFSSGISHFQKAGAKIDVARGLVSSGKSEDAIRILSQVDDYDGILYRAELKYEKGDYEGALADYLKAYAVKDRPEAIYGAGWSAFSLGDYNSAIEYLRIVAERFPDARMVSDVYLTLGDAYLNLKDYENAIASYEKVPEGSDLRDQAVFRIGLAYLRSGDYADAIKFFARLSSEESVYMLGYGYFQIGSYQKAIDVLKKIGPESRYYHSSLQMIGDSYYNLNDDHNAIAYYQRLFNESDSIPEVLAAVDGIEWVYKRRGDEAGFSFFLDSLIRSEKRTGLVPVLRMKLARTLLVKDFLKAVPHLKYVIEYAGPGSFKAEAVRLCAQGYLEKGMADSAERFARILKRISGHEDEGTVLLARTLYRMGKFREMVSVLKDFKDIPVKFYLLGLAQKNLGRLDLAIRNLDQAIRQSPPGEIRAFASLEMAQIRLMKGDLDQIEGLLRITIKEGPDSIGAKAQLLLGDLYQRKGDFKTAIVEFQRLEYLFPNYPDLIGAALLKIGESYERIGDNLKAIQTYQYLKKRYPKTNWSEVANEHLDRLNP
ncbi:MAG TPA: tetratricopeptide repeat protein [bacterium (Candidatus Stahlbacteria)]|nr:tetratricopeptide repeat protein [Candidatus Stahlbacteria bacterium]